MPTDPREPFPQLPATPHALDVDVLLADLSVDGQQGLSAAQATRRLEQHGPNQVRIRPPVSGWRVLLSQLKGPMTIVLMLAACASFLSGQPKEAAAIAAVVLFNTAIGYFTELRAARSVESLRTLSDSHATVVRGGDHVQISADDVVPGDLLIHVAGDVVAADARILRARGLSVDESTFTGESAPVVKQTGRLEAETPVAERTNMLFRGTSVVGGDGLAVVVRTGGTTELGRIALLVGSAESVATPLEKRLAVLAARLLWVSVGLAVAVAGAGLLTGWELRLAVETAVALAVATVPEGLPVIMTLALARGMWRMAKRRALVNTLSAVETLGSTNVIITDKTGTLTENQMSFARLVLPERNLGADELDVGSDLGVAAALRVAALCNEASLADTPQDAEGDPMEVALLRAARAAGLDLDACRRESAEIEHHSFDAATKMMATVHARRDGCLYAVKGAPEAVLRVAEHEMRGERTVALDDERRAAWARHAENLARAGHRVLALASKTSDTATEPPYRGLAIHGLVGLVDPPREEVKRAIPKLKSAGIRLVMATGDHGATAAAVAKALALAGGQPRVILGRDIDASGAVTGKEDAQGGIAQEALVEADIVARATPEQKLILLRAHQRAGGVVAMLGDGVNDAPALEQADIGVAMGQRGTQVAQEAADVILLDDRFESIVVAVEQGRIIFNSVRLAIVYLLSCNLSEVLIVALAALAGAPLPLLPLQILFLNLVTDVFPAFALARGHDDPSVMRQAPRARTEPLLDRPQWGQIVRQGLLLTASVLVVFGVALGPAGLRANEATTCAFLALGFAQLFHVFSVASRPGSSRLRALLRDPLVWGAIGLCSVLLFAAVYLPPLRGVLRTTPPSAPGWALITSGSLAPLLLVHAWGALGGHTQRTGAPRNELRA